MGVLALRAMRYLAMRVAKETAEDEAVNKVIHTAAAQAASRTREPDASPDLTMREGQKEFAATSEAGAAQEKEVVMTEADIVKPASGAGTGDRLVDTTIAKPKEKIATVAKIAKVSMIVRTRKGEKSALLWPVMICWLVYVQTVECFSRSSV